MILWIHSAAGLSVERGSHEPGDGPGQEVLIAEADVARHARVSLPEHLRHGLELSAHLDEAVQLDAGSCASHGVAAHQVLRKLGAQIVAHLSEGWRGDNRGQIHRMEVNSSSLGCISVLILRLLTVFD